jgi:hypothetical protein
MSVTSTAQTHVFPAHALGLAARKVQDAAAEWELRAGGVVCLTGDSRWRMVVCLRGVIWITQERDMQDYVLTPGEMFLVTQPGKVVVQGLQDAAVKVTPSLKTAPYVGDYVVFA